MNVKQEKRTSIDKLFLLQHESWRAALWELSARSECVRIAWLTLQAARITAKFFPCGNAAGERFDVWNSRRQIA